jgi:hypothetical protein
LLADWLLVNAGIVFLILLRQVYMKIFQFYNIININANNKFKAIYKENP